MFQNHQDAMLLQQMQVAEQQAVLHQHALATGMMQNVPHQNLPHHPGIHPGLELDYYALLQAQQNQAQLNQSSLSRKKNEIF